jgi:predicted CXXCH cytochrome family protein
MAGLIPGEFHSAASDITYRVFARDGAAWMSYMRSPASPRGGLEGEHQLLYFVGSATRGRTYLYRDADQWFELPVNFYRRRDAWAMAPAYDGATTMPAPLPVDANCLHCHATEVETPLPEARNRFSRRPFDEGGIGCSACHGDPARHLAAHGRGPILNPGKLAVAARDSSCIQCHLEGNAVVYRPGRSLAQFRPGDNLSDFAVYFVRASQTNGGERASSQYEALLKSACKRASGDRLTCTTCHDPHSEPAPAERVAYFRARCLSCHTSPALATEHHPDQPDCATCHMPSRSTADISHEQVTDHDIEAQPVQDLAPRAMKEGEQLVTVGGVAAGDREFGLAYAQLAQKGDLRAGERALRLLTQATQQGANDEQVHVNLGFLDQISGDLPGARAEYAAALRENPFNASALTNRAILDAKSGDLNEAIRLLDRLVKADPSQTQAGLDLAFLECRLGQAAESRAVAEKLSSLNPDSPDLRRFLATGALGDQGCPAEASADQPSGAR